MVSYIFFKIRSYIVAYNNEIPIYKLMCKTEILYIFFIILKGNHILEISYKL